MEIVPTPPKKRVSVLATASLTLSCISVASLIALLAISNTCFDMPDSLGVGLLFGLLAFLPGIWCGVIAQSKIRKSGGALAGEGRASGGLVLGYLQILFLFVSMLFPVGGHNYKQARRAQAKSDVMQIAAAIKQYYAEYGKYPIAYEGQDQFSRDLTVGLTKHNSTVFNTLRSIPEGINREDHLNPRKIVFFEGKHVPDPSHPAGGFAEGALPDSGAKGSYFDPWGREYMIRIHYDATKPFVAPDGTTVNSNVIVWSLGQDGIQGTADDIVSWK